MKKQIEILPGFSAAFNHGFDNPAASVRVTTEGEKYLDTLEDFLQRSGEDYLLIPRGNAGKGNSQGPRLTGASFISSLSRGTKSLRLNHKLGTITGVVDGFVSPIVEAVTFDSLRTPTRGASRGPGSRARTISPNIGESTAKLEAFVKSLLRVKYPAPKYIIVDNTDGAGADFIIKLAATGRIVARVDAKSSPYVTARQKREALSSPEPFWIVGRNFKLLISRETVTFEATGYKVYAKVA